MGNSASNANNPSRSATGTINRTSSISPGPGNPHRSMKNKKRSLELPDLAALSLTPVNPYVATSTTTTTTTAIDVNRGRVPTKTASIPIPTLPPSPFNHYQLAQAVPEDDDEDDDLDDDFGTGRGAHRKRRRGRPPMPSISDLDDLNDADHYFEPPSHSQPFPPRRRPSRTSTQSQSFVSAPRGRQQQPTRQQQQQMRHIQELYDRSQEPPPPGVMQPGQGRTKPGFKQEVVRSSIPTVLGQPEEEEQETAYVPAKEDLSASPVPVKISWRAGGKEVILARAGDDDWKGRSPMVKEPGNIWSLTVYLQPGTHHVRFLVDNQWRVADDLPAAVDDQGSLANYVAVPLTFDPAGNQILPTVPQIPQSIPLHTPTRRVVPGQSFWSTDSSADGEDIDTSVRNLHTTSPREKEKDRFAAAYIQARWTSVLPPELIEAAKEEETYLAASAGQYDGGATTKITGFVPAPNIPPAPGLPRHLDKLILNSRVGEQKSKSEGSVNGSTSGTTTPAPGGTSGVGSGQASSSRRDRGGRERDKDRERDRDRPRDKHRDRDREKKERDKDRNRTSRRADHPPPPPPSVVSAASTVALDEFPMPRVPANSTASLPIERSSYTYPSYPETIVPIPEAGPFVPFGEVAPNNNNSNGTLRGGNNQNSSGSTVGPSGNLGGSNNGSGGGSTPVNSPGTPTGHTPPTSTLIGLTGTGPIPPHIAKQLGTKFIGASSPPPASSLSPPLLERTPVSGSRAITIDTANMPSLTDDGSVLPVPSHVVLHHLCTSAIRNGVLAVANTTRYKKKYLTTIYYKPTSMMT